MVEKVNHEEVKKLFDIKKVKEVKNLAIREQKYELAAYLRDQEKYLLTLEGQFWANEEQKRVKAEERAVKLKRLFGED